MDSVNDIVISSEQKEVEKNRSKKYILRRARYSLESPTCITSFRNGYTELGFVSGEIDRAQTNSEVNSVISFVFLNMSMCASGVAFEYFIKMKWFLNKCAEQLSPALNSRNLIILILTIQVAVGYKTGDKEIITGLVQNLTRKIQAAKFVHLIAQKGLLIRAPVICQANVTLSNLSPVYYAQRCLISDSLATTFGPKHLYSLFIFMSHPPPTDRWEQQSSEAAKNLVMHTHTVRCVERRNARERTEGGASTFPEGVHWMGSHENRRRSICDGYMKHWFVSDHAIISYFLSKILSPCLVIGV